jgi:hypothetical protein
MQPEFKAWLAEQAGHVGSRFVGMAMDAMFTPKIKQLQEESLPRPIENETLQPVQAVAQRQDIIIPAKSEGVVTKTAVGSVAGREELDYRWECVMKHLGGASVILREAYERANDNQIGDATAEKIMAAMNEHAGMEDDLEKMLTMPEAKEMANRLLSGTRAFRAAAWKAGLPRGSGTKQEVADAREWNDMFFQMAYSEAKKNPGQECVLSGM